MSKLNDTGQAWQLDDDTYYSLQIVLERMALVVQKLPEVPSRQQRKALGKVRTMLRGLAEQLGRLEDEQLAGLEAVLEAELQRILMGQFDELCWLQSDLDVQAWLLEAELLDDDELHSNGGGCA